MPACNGADRGRVPHPKGRRLPPGVGGREPSANRRRLGCRDVGGVATTSAGAPAATEVLSVAGTAVVTPRSAPRPMGRPRASRRRVARCLSRTRRKVPGRFLGEGVAATPPPYPTRYPATLSAAVLGPKNLPHESALQYNRAIQGGPFDVCRARRVPRLAPPIRITAN
jgi:hypothetical protein